MMKLRQLDNLPVFDEEKAEVVARVERAVVGDDFKLAYVVVDTTEGGAGLILKKDLRLGKDAVRIRSTASIKSYAGGEELSMNKRKIGDKVFDRSGRELGVVSDLVIEAGNMEINRVEVSGGAIKDMLTGREQIPLEQVEWRTPASAVAETEGSDEE